jgi:hypothetical protein
VMEGRKITDFLPKIGLSKSEGLPPKSNLCYLASTTGSNISILITYILFLTKLQKRQIPQKEFALFKNDITGSESTFKMTDT